MSRYLRSTLAAEVVADPHAGPMCLAFIVQDMTSQIPAPALPYATWRGVPVMDLPYGSEVFGYFVDVVWPEVVNA